MDKNNHGIQNFWKVSWIQKKESKTTIAYFYPGITLKRFCTDFDPMGCKSTMFHQPFWVRKQQIQIIRGPLIINPTDTSKKWELRLVDLLPFKGVSCHKNGWSPIDYPKKKLDAIWPRPWVKSCHGGWICITMILRPMQERVGREGSWASVRFGATNRCLISTSEGNETMRNLKTENKWALERMYSFVPFKDYATCNWRIELCMVFRCCISILQCIWMIIPPDRRKIVCGGALFVVMGHSQQKWKSSSRKWCVK